MFYNRLPNYKLLKSLFDFVAPPSNPVQVGAKSKRTAFLVFMILLTQLRLNSTLQDFAYKFNISVATVSSVFLKWLTINDIKFRPVIELPVRKALWASTPSDS